MIPTYKLWIRFICTTKNTTFCWDILEINKFFCLFVKMKKTMHHIKLDHMPMQLINIPPPPSQVMVANCVAPEPCSSTRSKVTKPPPSKSPVTAPERGNPVSYRDLNLPLYQPFELPASQCSHVTHSRYNIIQYSDSSRERKVQDRGNLEKS